MPGPLPTDVQKPPLGLRPRWLVEEQRAAEVSAAILRYLRAGYHAPQEWLDEFHYLTVRAVEHQRAMSEQEGDSIEAMERRGSVYKAKWVCCLDACGDCGLTVGKEYEIVGFMQGMIRVMNDAGEVREYFMERFRGVVA